MKRLLILLLLLSQFVIPVQASTEQPISFLQTDNRWGNEIYSISNNSSQTIATSGCGPTSMAIVLNYYIDNSITVWDVYVALNAQYHDYHCYYKELFPSDSDEIIKDKIINSAIVFWFKDEDGKHNKVWNYFK